MVSMWSVCLLIQVRQVVNKKSRIIYRDAKICECDPISREIKCTLGFRSISRNEEFDADWVMCFCMLALLICLPVPFVICSFRGVELLLNLSLPGHSCRLSVKARV